MKKVIVIAAVVCIATILGAYTLWGAGVGKWFVAVPAVLVLVWFAVGIGILMASGLCEAMPFLYDKKVFLYFVNSLCVLFCLMLAAYLVASAFYGDVPEDSGSPAYRGIPTD